jgi:FkbM family methyltransferase
MKEFGGREHHLDVPKILVQSDLNYGKGKVVIDIGLNDGQEFFAAINSGYTVYGFEANPVSVEALRKTCEEYDGKTHGVLKCIYVNAKDISEHMPPSPFTSYLIEGGAGSSSTVLNMSIAGPGSSFVEDAPTKADNLYKMVTIIPVHKVADADVYLFKLDVQGFEYDVLKGSKAIFDQRIVKTMLMEVYPRGLGNAGIDFDEFLHFLWYDLGMLCSSANPVGKTSFPMDHPNSLPTFGKYLKSLTNSTW